MCRSAPGWRGREHDCGSSTRSRCATSPSPRLAAEAFSTHCPSATAAGKVPFRGRAPYWLRHMRRLAEPLLTRRLIPALVADGWWRHVVRRVPLR